MSFRLLSVVLLLGLGAPAFAKPPELPLDPTITCCACGAQEPVDDLLLVTLVEQQKSWTYRDLLLETLVPVLRTSSTASRLNSLVNPRRVRWGVCLCSSPMRTSSHPRCPASGGRSKGGLCGIGRKAHGHKDATTAKPSHRCQARLRMVAITAKLCQRTAPRGGLAEAQWPPLSTHTPLGALWWTTDDTASTTYPEGVATPRGLRPGGRREDAR